MVKSQKSSATSGTRKKNARKATQAVQESASAVPPPSPAPKQSKPKGGKNPKLSKREAREQRKKVYIPPTKPAPPVLDPLDATGLVHVLPAELVVVLRALGKKDAVTRGKAVEELAKWVEDAIREQAVRDHDRDRYEQGGEKADPIVKMLPVWVCLHITSHFETTNLLSAPSCPSTLYTPYTASSLPCRFPSRLPSASQPGTRGAPYMGQ